MAEYTPNQLKEIQELTQSIARSYDDMSIAAGKRNKQLARELKLQSDIVKQIDSEESLLEAIDEITEHQNKFLKANYSISNKLKKSIETQATIARGVLETEQKRFAVIGNVEDITDSIASKTTGWLSDLQSTIEDIPILGKTMAGLIPFDSIKSEISSAAGNFLEGFTKSFSTMNVTSKGFFNAFKGGLSEGFTSMTNGASKFGAALIGPQGILIAIVALMALGVVRLVQVDNALHHVKESTGLLKSQLKDVHSQISSVHATTADLGASFHDIADGISDFSNEFDGIQLASDATLASMITLNKNFGIGTKESAKLNKIFQNIGGLTQEQSQALVGQTAMMAKMGGVAPQAVIQDMADNAEYAYKFFKQNPKALAKAAVEARKLGTSIGDAGKVAEGLLDFESSITDEIEASAMLGANLNFAKSRQLAYDGKLVESQQAVISEIQKKVDLNNIDIFQQEALAKASGMSMEQITDQIRIRKQISKYNKADQKHANELLAAGIDITNMTAEDLNKQTEKLHNQQEMQTSMDKLMNSFKGIGSSLMDAMMPLGKILIGVLLPVFYVLKVTLQGIVEAFKGLGTVIDYVLIKPIVFMYEQFTKFADILKEKLQPAFDRMKEAGSKIVHAFQPLFDMFGGGGGGLSKVLGIIGDILGTTILLAIDGIVFGVNLIVTVFEVMANIVATIGSSITKYIVDPIMMAVDTFKTMGSWLGFGDASVEVVKPQEHINDGIVQNGRVITTNPADTILATKTPGKLMGDSSTNETLLTKNNSVTGNSNNDALISKINELIVAVKSNKDVYIDKDKVTNTLIKSTEKHTGNIFGLGVA
jgi:hypothetical protein